jgi:hypothetical protein
VLWRQVNRPKVRPEERIVLSVLQRLRPVAERMSSLVTRASDSRAFLRTSRYLSPDLGGMPLTVWHCRAKYGPR